MMTRKDYVATAEILKNFYDNNPVETNDFLDLIYDFADLFAKDNPNFKSDKFISACGFDIVKNN